MAQTEVMQMGKCENYDKIPPEGGWGFLVLLGLAIFLTFTLGTFPSLALIFGEFLKDLGEETSALTMLMSWYFASFSCVGLVTNYCFKIFSVRAVALSGAMVFMLGSILVIFARTVVELIFTFGVLEGAGFGLMISASYTTFNGYFVKKRIMMMSIAQSIFGLGTMIYPIVVQYLMDEYGYRGVMAIRAGLHGHVIFGMLVMHPVEWHMKKVKREDVLLLNEDRNADIVSEKEHKDSHNNRIVFVSNENVRKYQKNNEDIWKKSVSSLARIGLWNKIVDFLDLTLMTDPIYVNISLGISFALYSDMSFFAIQPLYLLQLNYSKTSIAQIIAIGATADLISRIFLIISSPCIRLKARDIYLIGATLTIVARFGFLYVNDFLGMAIMTAVMGFLRTWIHVPLPLVFADYLSPERFPSGYGLFMFIEGIIMFLFAPIVGWIRDATENYIFTFHCLTLAMAFCVIPWLIEILWLKLKKSQTKLLI